MKGKYYQFIELSVEAAIICAVCLSINPLLFIFFVYVFYRLLLQYIFAVGAVSPGSGFLSRM